jgi:hypothetical protein
VREGLKRLIEHIQNETYGFGGHEQAEKDYQLITYYLKDKDNMSDDEICKVLYEDYGCPQPYDFELDFDTDEWCEKIRSNPDGIGSVHEDFDVVCPECWREFLTKLGSELDDKLKG